MRFQTNLISMINFVGCTVFRPEAFKFCQSAEDGAYFPTLKAPERKTVHLTKLIMEIKVV